MRRAALFLWLVFAPLTSVAQSPGEQVALAAWVDTLQRTSTRDQLEALSSRVSTGAKQLRQLRSAWLNTRRGELGADRGAFERALFDFVQSSARHRDWPWPEYGAATVFRLLDRGSYVAVGSDGQQQGESHADAAWRHLRAALLRDATMPEARAFTISAMVAAGDRELPIVQQESLDRLTSVAAPEADVWLVLGRTLRGRGKYDSALHAFESALASGGDASRLALERARTYRALGDSTAAVLAYWSGARHPSTVGRLAYRTDLAWIVDSTVLRDFDHATTDSLFPWLKRFWAQRDMRSAKTTDGRLSEHLRRWAIAFANFRVVAPWRRTMFARVEFGFEGMDPCIASNGRFYRQLAAAPPVDSSDLRRKEPLLDHRGLIYLRHGAPIGRSRRAFATGATAAREVGGEPPELGFEVPPSQSSTAEVKASRGDFEAWLFWIDGQWRMLFFRGSKALGYGAGTTLSSYLPMSFVNEWLAVGQLAPAYAPAARRIEHADNRKNLLNQRAPTPASCLPEVTRSIARSRADASVGISTDSDSPPITQPWNAVLDIFTVGSGTDASGRALITFALPTTTLTTTPRDDGRVGHDVRFRISAYDRVGGHSIQIDTTRHFSGAVASGPRQYLSGLFELPLPPGRWDLTILARQQSDSAGAFAERRDRTIAAGDRLALSDIVTGISTGRPFWTAADGPFPLNVLGVWTPKTPIEIYYEVYGVPTGTEFRTTLNVRPVGSGRGRSVSLSTTDRSLGVPARVRRTIGLEQLAAGEYRLIVKIARGADTTVSERPLLIVKQ